MSEPVCFPLAELVTDRLLLRAHTAEDVTDNAAMFDDDEVRRWLDAPYPYTRLESEQWCTRTSGLARILGDGINWAAVDGESGRLVGGFGLKHTDWRARVTEVGYLVASWARGQGVATEAVSAICHWVLDDQRFNRIQLTAATDNHASRRVAAKCGFTYEGTLRNAGFTLAGQVDLAVYGLVPADLGLPRAA